MSAAQEAVPGRTASEVLGWSRALLDPALRAAVRGLPPETRRVAEYHFGWRDEQGRPAEGSGGKAIRPALTLLAARAVGGDPADALPAAVAVELAHNFSLLHDDVMDGDLTRRHQATAWSVFGVNAAILAGDALIALAYETLADGPVSREGLRALSRAVVDLVEGQSIDMAFERRTDVSLAECEAMAAGKTGALLGGACALGASCGGGDAAQVARLRAFGELLGLAFQVVDDLLGIWGDPAVTGKPVHSDLVNRKKSLPVVAALTSGTAAGAALAELYRGEGPLTGSGPARAAELIGLAGGRDWGEARAAELLDAALTELDAATPDPVAAADLHTLATLVTARDH
ncbi:family 2 encapsulin nanocompartment cargo protein polyprenyl transferase [Actinomadura parmotrematis]|uniref:Polyprenyl synthetase family protein n=1 Tax=Actinomadura parmotrematis TaxID=2864039 RepID=A0ABS7G2D4_9ACTN|nr:family 2 encapsulin nanocompartment cargo protein polyprenyl transferase [Actinomadura parmotrematis]MBW8486641.1 polyprenyl synthetase family protein [Actinomadura parmotrematis]